MMQRAVRFLTVGTVLLGSLGLPRRTMAQSGLAIEVSAQASCEVATFTLGLTGGTGSADLTWDFGDGETLLEPAVAAFPHPVEHPYPGAGAFDWSALAVDLGDPALTGTAMGTLSIGPSVTLTSDIFPPVLTLESGQAVVQFTAEVSGGEPPFTYSWDLDGDGTPDAGADPNSGSASFTYTSAGEFESRVTGTDSCGLAASDTLSVVVFDPQEACHPRAQQIARAVSFLFPDRAEQLYTCEQIFGMFQGDLTGSQLGFGRMWHAYQMIQTIDDLTWEEILDWQLDGSGWGLLAQLDRFAEALDDVGTRELVEMVLSGEASIQDIRAAVRFAVRDQADFSDALSRLSEGANPGGLGQFYRTVEQLQISAEELDGYLETGVTLSDLRHAASVASRFEADLEAVAAARAAGHRWGEIGQAYHLADETTSAEAILEQGVQDYRRAQQAQNQVEREDERNARMAAQLAQSYGLTEAEVMAIFASCGSGWGCVRDQLRNQGHEQDGQGRDDGAAERLAAQYGVTLEQVWSLFSGECNGDWNCVRRHLRQQNLARRGKGRNP